MEADTLEKRLLLCAKEGSRADIQKLLESRVDQRCSLDVNCRCERGDETPFTCTRLQVSLAGRALHVPFCPCSQVQNQLGVDPAPPGLLLWAQGRGGGAPQGDSRSSALLRVCPVRMCRQLNSAEPICRQVPMQMCRITWVTRLYTKQPILEER